MLENIGIFSMAPAMAQHAAARQALSAQGWLAYGEVQQAAGEYQAALEAWEQAEASGISRATSAELRLPVHLALENYPAALADLRRLVAYHPADARWRYRLGLLLASQDPEAALAHLIQASDLNPHLSEPAQQLVARIRTASLAGDRTCGSRSKRSRSRCSRRRRSLGKRL